MWYIVWHNLNIVDFFSDPTCVSIEHTIVVGPQHDISDLPGYISSGDVDSTLFYRLLYELLFVGGIKSHWLEL